MNSDRVKKREIFFVILVIVSILFTGFVAPIKALSWSSDDKITLEEIRNTLRLQDLNISDSELEEILSYPKISGEKTTLRQAAEIVVLNDFLLRNHMVEFMSQLSHTILDIKGLIYGKIPKLKDLPKLIRTAFNAFNIIKGINDVRMQKSVNLISDSDIYSSLDLAKYLDRSLDEGRKNKINSDLEIWETPALKPHRDKIVQMAKMRRIAMDNKGEINALQNSVAGIIRDRVNKRYAYRNIIEVPQTNISPTTITINPAITTVDIGRIPQFTLSIHPANADQRVTWSVKDTMIGTIDINGFFTAKKIGKTTITATSIVNTNIVGTATVTIVGSDMEISPATPINLTLWQGQHTAHRIEVKNVGGGGTLHWGVTDDRDWISTREDLTRGFFITEPAGVTGYKDKDRDMVSVIINTAGLGVGTHTGTVTFTQTDRAGEIIKIPITLEVRAVDMEISPATPINSILWQGQHTTHRIEVKNVGGGGTLWWSATDDRGWIYTREELTQRILTTESMGATEYRDEDKDVVSVIINTAGLGIGTHTGTVTFAGAGEMIKIPVILEVRAIDMEVSPATPIEVILWQGQHTTHRIEVKNVGGGGTLWWGVTDDRDWIHTIEELTQRILTTESMGVTEYRDEDKDVVRVTINTAGLGVGTHTGTVTFAGAGEIIKIPVTLTIPRPAPIAIDISPTKTEIDVNATKQFTLNMTPADADQSVIWSVDNEWMGTIDKNGIFTAVGPGFVTITATSLANPAISGTAIITVTKPVVKPLIPEPERKKEEGREWKEGETKTWKTPKNWVPGGIVSNTLHLKNSGNINAARTTIHIATGTTNAPKRRVNDSRVLDRTDMDTQIRITKATFGGVNVNDLIGKTLHQLRGDTVNLSSGINAGAERSLFLELKFDCKGKKCAGYMGDKVEANFTFGLHQR